MGPLLLGIILLCVHAWVAMPYPLDVIVLIAGIIAVVYGLYVIIMGGPWRREPVTRRGRWLY
jgi:uncharacterized membrane protein